MAHRIQFRPVTPELAQLLADTMRPADAAEVWASDNETPAEAVQSALEASVEATAVLVGDELLAITGLAVTPHEDLGQLAVPWALTTVAVDRYPRQFWAASRQVVGILCQQHHVLFQMVDARYGRALAWLARLGFKVHDPIPFGADGLPFHPVVKMGTDRRIHV